MSQATPDTAEEPAIQRPALDPLRVAFLSPCYWPEVHRGAERIVSELATGLVQDGHSVRLITSHPGPPRRSVEDGIEVLRFWRPPEARLRRRLYDDYLTHAPFSYLALLAGHDDVAHAVAAPDAIAAGYWMRRGRGRALFTYMGIPTRHFLVLRRRRVELTLAACRGAAAVVALSRAAAAAFWENLGVKARVIHPGVDTDIFTPGGSRAEAPLIFCGASLEVEYKRVDMLIRALPLVRRVRRNARLALFRPADTSVAQRLERECEGLELLTRPAGPNDALLCENYRRAWVSALPSRGEAFGLVLAESLACGTPVVGTNAGGIPDVITRPEIGRLFEGDEQALAGALLEAIELSEHAGTAAACRTRALELSSDVATKAYEALYNDLLAGRDA